jgi:zinc transporter, ZIP family
MVQAFALGAIAQASLLVSGILPFFLRIPDRIVGILAGIGAGALIGAVAFDLVPEAISAAEVALWFIVGAGIFLVADRLIEERFGGEDQGDGGTGGTGDGGSGGDGGPLGIVLGSVVDGVPESVIFGIQLAAGVPISIAFLAAVFVSNIPQALAPSADLVRSGWQATRMIAMWGAVVLACGVASALGWLAASNVDTITGARAAAIAAGGLLAMLTGSLVPFAYQKGGSGAALGTVVGFCAALAGT